MKALILLLFAACSLSAQQVFTNRTFSLLFDYPIAEITNATFRVHGSTNATAPVDTWEVLTSDFVIDSTNVDLVTFISSNKVPALLPVQFYVVSASNEWGVSFSEVLRTAPPSQGQRLRLR